MKDTSFTIFILMGFFSNLFGSGPATPFKSEEFYAKNRASQASMTPKTMEQLRAYGVTDETQLKLEYFFYTNSKEKASKLFEKLQGLGYSGKYCASAKNEEIFVITGWTARMSMDNDTVVEWTVMMCDIGKDMDCEFDGWGTNPKQNQTEQNK
jgi:hypothetical protein